MLVRLNIRSEWYYPIVRMSCGTSRCSSSGGIMLVINTDAN